jgi:undecaprenyl-diphosphatase
MTTTPTSRRLTLRDVAAALGWWALIPAVAVAGLWLATPHPPSTSWTLDAAGLTALAAGRGPVLDALFEAVTWLGSLYVLGPLTMLVLLGLLWRGRGCDGVMLALGLGGAALLSSGLKALVDRERPALFPALVPLPADGSYPSGHTIQVAAFALALFFLAQRRGWPRRPLIAALLIALVAAVAFSRLYLQVHFPSDVIAGLVLGLAWVLGLERLAPGLGLRRRGERPEAP